MPRKQLSAMEYTILGIAWKRGPCTTYALMKELASSTSTYYKAKAGTAYPLVDRLVKAGLLEEATEVGPKGEKLIQVTVRGKEALHKWLSEPISLGEVAHTVDFIRLRVFYLGAVSLAERRELLDKAIATLREHLDECERAAERYAGIGDAFSELATRGVVFETKARIEWLCEIRERALKIPPGKP